MGEKKILRIAALADLHTRENDKGRFSSIFQKINEDADVLLLAGDLTDTGDEQEAEILLTELAQCTIPIVCVLGNHDYEKGRQKLIKQVLLRNSGLHLLDGEGTVIEGVGFAGVKGFGGGFDNYMLAMFGEREMKDFVEAAVEESLRLERALAGLDKHQKKVKKIALMHYSPSSKTVAGEPEALYPFLGCSRLAEPLVRQKVEAAFHGHAHGGTLSGMISKVKVFNVAQTVLKKEGIKGCFLYELEV
jgi:Icc-related predicted phosphoesterase